MRRTLFVVMALLFIVNIASAQEILKLTVGGSLGLTKGTLVKLSGDGAVAVCGAGEEPVGIIIGFEEDGGSSYYLIASSDMIDNVLLDSDVTAGDQLVPAADGKAQRKDLAPEGFVVGVALVDGLAGERIKIMASFGMGESHNREHSLTSPDDHTDVVVTDLAFGDLLGYDGEKWQNFPSSGFAPSDHNHLVNFNAGSDIISAESLFVDGEWNLQLAEDVVGNAELSPIAAFVEVQLDDAMRFNITNSDRTLNFTAEGGLTVTNPSSHTLHFDATGIGGEDNQTIITGDGITGAEFPGTTGNVTLAVDLLTGGGLQFTTEKLAVDFGIGANQAARGNHAHANMLTGTGTDGYNAYFTGTSTLAAEQFVAVSRGGMGANMNAGTAGAIPVSSSATAYSVLPAVATGNALISAGAGVAPVWGKVRLSGSPTHIEGTLPVANGGTGLTALGTPTQLLRVNAGGSALEYWTADYLTQNQEITLTGHVTGTGRTSIATTISDGVVTNAKLALVPGNSIKGRAPGTPGVVQDITFTANNQVLGTRDGDIVPISIGSSGGLAWFDHDHEGTWDNYNYWTALPFDGGTAFNVPTTTEVSFYGSGGLKVKRGPGFSLHFDATEVSGTNQRIITNDGIKGANFPGLATDTIEIEIDLMTNSGLKVTSGKLGVDFAGAGSAYTVARSDHTHEGDFDNYGYWRLYADDDGGDDLFVYSHDRIEFQGAGNTTISRSGNTIVISSSDTSGGSGSEPNQLITTGGGIKGANYGTRGDIVIEADLTSNGGLLLSGSPDVERTLGADFGTGYNQVARGDHQHEVVFAGDATGTVYIPGTVNLQLSSTGVSSGTYGGSGANIAHIQVDSKGRLTYAGNRELSAMDIGAAGSSHTHAISFSGDATGSATIPGDIALTLSNTGVTAGTYGNIGANIPNINVDGKGRITSASNRPITATDIGAAPSAHTHTITFGGDLSGSGTVTGTVNGYLANTGVSAGTYGNTGANVASITVDAKGRLTGAANRAISAADLGASPAGHQHYHSEVLGVGANDHHNRLHSMTSVNDHTAGKWMVFYSDGANEMKELPIGAAGQVLKSNGPSSAPSWGEGGSAGSDLWNDASGYVYPNNSATGGDIGTNLRVADTRTNTYGFYASMQGTYGGYFITSGAGSYGIRTQGVAYGIYAIGAMAGYFDGNARITGDLQVGNGTTTGKINCYEVDPAYLIDGKYYSVYGGENIGHRVDLVATGRLSSGEAVIDLTQQKEGTDLWLFSKVVDISTAMVMVTANGPANLYAYMEGSKLHVKMLSGEDDVPFTYRISATRLDKAHQPVHVMNSWRDEKDPLGYIEIDAAGNAINRYIWDFEKDKPEVENEN